ncbi:MFS transporter [Actinoallomurus iriomotensis]|uniref:Major facilitator superfamily (MFS) profile domain-containing protein n=1 Tax=Actinoallomurus iriomotensis TaxID=478107 RepID=A0A9W6RMR5_9ACTN|nr:MFS transporter [Actinoallomurus iriomotensis]GLY78513.1 hypothetical protein Airi01_067800 [Actinoallomurus iriomotensis]
MHLTMVPGLGVVGRYSHASFLRLRGLSGTDVAVAPPNRGAGPWSLRLGTAVSSNVLVVDVLRGVQGLAAGATVSAGSAVLAHATSGARRVRVFGLLGASFGGGTAAGPLVAGALAPLGWRSIFVVIALGAAIAFVASRYAQESSDPSTPRPDLPGMACFGGALLLLSLGFVNSGTAG